MARSILQDEKRCWICGSVVGLECHHILGGTANRKLSEKYGLKVWLCHEHHTGDSGAQYVKEMNLQLKQEAQRAFEKTNSRELWMRLIGKNYL